jgi:hypothetical protein
LTLAGTGLAEFRVTHRDLLTGLDGDYEMDATARFTALDVGPLRLSKSRTAAVTLPDQTVETFCVLGETGMEPLRDAFEPASLDGPRRHD